MSGALTFEQVAAVVAEHLCVPLEKVTRDASLIDDLGADSLDIVELATVLEELGGAELSDRQLDKIERVEQLLEAVNAE